MCILAEDTSSASCYNDGIVRYELDEDICHMADELPGVWEATGVPWKLEGRATVTMMGMHAQYTE
eukprot:529503-Pyramimonas_sp.AAC.1